MSLGNPPQVWSLRPRPQGIAGSRSSFAQNGTGFFTNGRKFDRKAEPLLEFSCPVRLLAIRGAKPSADSKDGRTTVRR